MQTEQTEVDQFVAPGLDLSPFLSVDRFAHAARECAHRMDGLAAQHAHDVHGLAAVGDDAAADLHADLVDQAQDVAFGRVCIWPQDEVGRGEDVEMHGVIGDVEG